jgi:hypothetical protein
MLCEIADRVKSESSEQPNEKKHVSNWEFNTMIMAEATRMAQLVVRQQSDNGNGVSGRTVVPDRIGTKRGLADGNFATPTTSARKRIATDTTKKKTDGKKLTVDFKKRSSSPSSSVGEAEELSRLREENRTLKSRLDKVSAERDQLLVRLANLSTSKPNSSAGESEDKQGL